MNRSFLLAILACFLSSAFAAPAIPGADIFATNAPVLRVNIEIPRAGITSLQRDHRKDVMATVREGDRVYNNVAIHVKGAAGSLRDINSNPALTLHFAKSQTDQRFHGLRKIHLNNSVQDPSFTTENIVGQLFRDAGIPTPRASNARVFLNGRDLGFYVMKEGWTKEFLAIHFKDTKGNLYDGGFLQDIDRRMEKDGGDERQDQPDIDALAAAARTRDVTKRWEALQKVLDTDRFLTYMAIENLAWDWDGYMMSANNYRIYHDPTTDKLVFLPHGLDQLFHESNPSIYQPRMRGLVCRALMETPEGARYYRERVKDVYAKYFHLDVLTNRLNQLAKRNRETIVSDLGKAAAREHDGNVDYVRQRIVARWQNVKNQIEDEPVPINFAQGPVAIKGWSEANFGNGRVDRVEVAGKPSLHISADDNSFSSWRSRVMLEEAGKYRFEAMVRTKGLAGFRNEKGEGAGIRISMQNRSNKVVGDTDWTRLVFDFDVPGSSEITLVCESNANRGDAWFATDSLKLTKLR